jgi:MFS family permease
VSTQVERVEAPDAEAAVPSALAMVGLLAGPLLSMVDSSVVNVAVPDIARLLHTELATVQWTVSGYLLALAGTLAASAWLTRRFGSRRLY